MKKLIIFVIVISSTYNAFASDTQVTYEEFLKIHQEVKEKWLDPDRSMRLAPHGTGQLKDNENPTLFTSEYFFLVKKLGFMKGEIREEMLAWGKQLMDNIAIYDKNGNRVRGLYNRRKGDFKRHFSRDEQIGVKALDMSLDYELGGCAELREYGYANKWLIDNRTFEGRTGYNNPDGTISTPIDNIAIALRQPNFIEYVRLCAGRERTFLGEASVAATLLVTIRRGKDDTSGKILHILSLEAAKARNTKNLRRTRDKFYKKLRETYNTDAFLYEIFKIYYKNPNHPLIRLAKGLKL